MSVAQTISAETAAFYRAHAESFSHTRERGWEGFDLVADHLADMSHLSVLDLAAGNARFEGYLAQKLVDTKIDAHLVDAVPALLDSMNFQAQAAVSAGKLTITQTTLDLTSTEATSQLQEIICTTQPQLIVCFGFLHHIFGSDARRDFVDSIAKAALRGATLALSLWAPLQNERLAKKAARTTPLALAKLGLTKDNIEPGDCFLSWQDDDSYFRYIHSFSEYEVQTMEHIVMENTCFILDHAELDTNNYYIVARKKN